MSRRPNVVIFHTDQQRYDSLGCTGSTTAVTPHLDQLAREGVVFDRHISAHPVCMPSRAALFSGSYPQGNGVTQNGIPLPRSEQVLQHKDNEGQKLSAVEIRHVPTMMDVFRSAGYHTSSFGKLHLTCTNAPRSSRAEESRIRWSEEPMNEWHGPYCGFEHVEMTIGHGEDYVGHYAEWLKEHHPELVEKVASWKYRGEGSSRGWLYESIVPIEAHSSTWIADRAIAHIEEYAERQEEAPLFMFVGFPDPHFPFAPPKPLIECFKDKAYKKGVRSAAAAHLEERHESISNPQPEEGLEVANESSLHPSTWAPYYKEEAIQNLNRYESDYEQKAKQYTDAMIHLIDTSIGRIIDTLKQQGMEKDTIVLFTSDHGDFLGDYGLIYKADIGCRALNHVPFIMKAPEWLNQTWPDRVSQVMSNIDVFPTLCELAGVAIPDEVQGRSIIPCLNGSESPDADRSALVVCMSDNASMQNFSIWTNRYRYTWIPETNEQELYDHRIDPMETVNIAGLSEHAAVVERLHQAMLEQFLRTSRSGAGKVSGW